MYVVVCMYVYVCVCMPKRLYMIVVLCVKNVYVYVCALTMTHVCGCVCVYVWMCVPTTRRLHMYVVVCVCMYACVSPQ